MLRRISLVAFVCVAHVGDAQHPNTTSDAPLERVPTPRTWTNALWQRAHPIKDTSHAPYDIVHQDIVLDSIGANTYHGMVTTTFVVRATTLDSVSLEVGMLTPRAATELNGHALRTTLREQTLTVALPQSSVEGDTLRIALAFSGNASSGMLFLEPRDSVRRSTPSWCAFRLHADNQGNPWYPRAPASQGLRRMTWSVQVTAPSACTVLSNGARLWDRRTQDGMHVVKWSQATPMPGFVTTVEVAPLTSVQTIWHTTDGRRVPLAVYVPAGEPLGPARLALQQLRRAVAVFSARTGVPIPSASYTMLVVGPEYRIPRAKNNGTITLIEGPLPTADGYATRDETAVENTVHELAHEWAGTTGTSFPTPDESWLAEGIADFLTATYWAAVAESDITKPMTRRGTRAIGEYFVTYPFPRPLAEADAPLVPHPGGYYRGARVLRLLEQIIGPKQFWKGLNLYLTTHATMAASTHELEAAFTTTSNTDLRWFFDQWVYGAGRPSFVVRATPDSSAKILTLTIVQRQGESLATLHASSPANNRSPGSTSATTSNLSSGGASAAELDELSTIVSSGDTVVATVAPVFRVPVTIRVISREGDRDTTVWLTERSTTIVMRDVSDLRAVLFDVTDATFAANLVFPQPTTWLATQLAREETPSLTAWAVTQLRARARDSLAQAALIATATNGRYSLTREQALTALLSIATPEARAAVRRAAIDESPLVRLMAIPAVGRQPPEESAPILGRLLDREPNARVRAAAVTAALWLDEWKDSTARATFVHSVLLDALVSGADRDTVRMAALTALSALPRSDACAPDIVERLPASNDVEPRIAGMVTRLRDRCATAEGTSP